MKLQKISFINGGKGGIKIEGDEHIKKGNDIIVDGITRERKLPIPTSMQKTLDKLKPYYLMLTGHWRTEWEEFVKEGEVDKDKVSKKGYSGLVSLLDNTQIRGISKKNGVVITGFIKTLGNKGVCVNTPNLQEDDDFPFVDMISELCDEITEDTINFLKRKELFDQDQVKQLLMDFATRDGEADLIEEMTEEEQMEEYKKRLQEKGCIIIDMDTELKGLTSGEEEVVEADTIVDPDDF